MPIVETKIKFRSNTSQEFYTHGPVKNEVFQTSIKPLKEAGLYSMSYTYPDTVGNLVLQQDTTYADLDTFGKVDTFRSIKLDQEFINWQRQQNIQTGTVREIRANIDYKLTGIPDPFHVTTTYNFPIENDTYLPFMERSLKINYNHRGKLADIIVTSNSITVVHQYNSDADYTDNHFKDLMAFVPSLSPRNATRTIKYTDGVYNSPKV